MTSDKVILVGLKGRVTAIAKATGERIWSTKLPSGGSDFVTLLCEDFKVYACANGALHCLDLRRGEIMWTNDLPGLGFGLASLCLPNGESAPDAAAAEAYIKARDASHSAMHSAPMSPGSP